MVNVMKIKELVDKIVEENGEAEGESRRKEEKIVELKSLVLKIIENMEHYKAENYQLYKVIQAILNKLGLHTILMDIVGKFYDRDHFQLLINEIVNFYFEFIQDNEDNLKAVSSQYHLFTRKYSYPKLPLLLPLLFKASGNKEECFWVVYRNIDLKIEDQKSKEILYESIYNILQVCPPQVLDRIKGRVCYSLLTNPRFEDYIKGNVESTSFIKMVCLMGQNSQHVKERLM